MTEVLGDSRFRAPLVVSEHTIVAFHFLDDKHVIGVVDVGGSGGSVSTDARVNGS